MKFPQKRWRLRSLNYIIKRCEKPAQLPGSGRPRTSRTADNIDTLNDLILRQEVASRTHKTTCQIAKENGISRSVGRIIHKHSAKVPEETSRAGVNCMCRKERH